MLKKYAYIKWLLSFLQIHKQSTTSKETKKEKDNNSKNNFKNQNYIESYYHSNDNPIDFNFSDIDIFDTDKIIQRKQKCSCEEKCPKCIEADHRINLANIQTKLKISQQDDPLEKEADRIG